MSNKTDKCNKNVITEIDEILADMKQYKKLLRKVQDEIHENRIICLQTKTLLEDLVKKYKHQH